MTFNITLAIQELEIASEGHPDLDALRPAYPELGFFFDHVERYRAEVEGLETQLQGQHRSEIEDLERDVEQAEDRCLRLRNAALQIASLAMLLPGKSHAEAQATVTMINEIVKEEVE